MALDFYQLKSYLRLIAPFGWELIWFQCRKILVSLVCISPSVRALVPQVEAGTQIGGMQNDSSLYFARARSSNDRVPRLCYTL